MEIALGITGYLVIGFILAFLYAYFIVDDLDDKEERMIVLMIIVIWPICLPLAFLALLAGLIVGVVKVMKEG